MAETQSARVRVGRQGRLVVPAPLRRALRLGPGEELIARAEGERLVLERPGAGLERARGLVRDRGSGESAVDELLAERRQDARRDAQRSR